MKVSLLVPIYNVAPYIERCARSLFEQTYDNLEFLFVDDCTLDGSIQVLEDIISCYPHLRDRVRIISHPHHIGIAATRNELVEEASGEFVSFVDSDDWIEQNAIELLVKKQQETNADIVNARHQVHYTQGIVKVRESGQGKDKVSFLKELLCHKCTSVLWGRLIRLRLFSDHGIRTDNSIKYAEDVYVFPRLVYYAETIANIDDIVYHYNRENDDALTTALPANLEFQQAYIRVHQFLSDFFKGKNDDCGRISDETIVFYCNSFMQEWVHRGNKVNYDVLKNVIAQNGYHYCWHVIGWDNWLRRFVNSHYPLRRLRYLLTKSNPILLKSARTLRHIGCVVYLRFAYYRKLRVLRKVYGQRPLQVAFLVSEVAKWKGQSLYDAMVRSSHYTPSIIVYPMQDEIKCASSEQKTALEARVKFFQEKKMDVRNLWSVSEQRFMIEEMKDFDLCFYQQPWDIPPAPAPHKVASKMLTFYFPYVFGSYFINAETNMLLHYEVFRYILMDEKQVQTLWTGKSWMFAGKFVDWGHPMVDLFRNKTHEREKMDYVIYAPHFSFPNRDKKRIFPASTFLDNGRLILEFAKSNPGINWVFKPHPRLRRELIETCMWTLQEVDDYYNEWERIGTACYTSDYTELFFNSRAMITDCGSFLAEYSCTGNPIIHLIPGKLPAKPFPSVEPLFRYFYQAPDNTRLIELLDSIVLKREDPLKEERQACLKKLGLMDHDVAQNIINHIDQLMK